MKKHKIAVTWQMCGYVEIDAENTEDAMDKFESNIDHIPLPTDGVYVDSSFELSTKDVDEMEVMCGKPRSCIPGYISRKMIEDGLTAKVIVPKLEDDGIKAYIGDYWFYFGGSEFDETEPSDIPFDVLANEIMLAMEGFCLAGSPECDAEYGYYYSYLCENI